MDFETCFVECINTGNLKGITAIGVDKQSVNDVFICEAADLSRLRDGFPNLRRPTPLIYAICKEQEDVCTLLIEIGADVKQSVIGWRPIHFAAFMGLANVVTRILKIAPEEVNATTTGYSATPLHVASSCRRADIVGLLLSAGADVNAQNANGETALHMACAVFQKKGVMWLLAYGADRTIKDARGMTAEDIAKEKDNEKALFALALAERNPAALPARKPFNAPPDVGPDSDNLSAFVESLSLMTQQVQAIEERLGDME